MTAIHIALDKARKLLKDSGIESSALDSRMLLQAVLKLSHEELLTRYNTDIALNEIERFNDYIKRRATHEPVAKILEQKEFYGRMFKTTRDTLDPRPDSETLIETALSVFPKDKPIRILDVGTGTGCLVLTLLAELPLAKGVGVDISEKAIAVACENSVTLDLENRISWICGSWFDGVTGLFDVIISNPPYISDKDKKILSSDVIDFEPHCALFSADDGMRAYNDIISKTSKFLSSNGYLIFEIGYNQSDLVADLLVKASFCDIKKDKDLSGIYRVVSGRLKK